MKWLPSSSFVNLIIAGILLVACAACDVFGSDNSTGKIVFAIQPGEDNYQISTMRADGTDRRQLTFPDEPFHAAAFPSWSPDGERIVFASSRGAPMGLAVLYVMNADGSEMHPLIDNPRTGQPQFGSHPV